MEPPQRVFQRYPTSDTSLAGRYARSIAMFRRGDIQNAMPIIDSLTKDLPDNPYFWELKAQAYMENGQAAKGIPAIKRARDLLPNNGLLTELHASMLLATEDVSQADQALSLLRLAKKTEPDMPAIYKDMARAYGLKGDVARADLATAEFYYATGDRDLALKKARLAQQRFAKGTPEWLRANDLVTFAASKKWTASRKCRLKLHPKSAKTLDRKRINMRKIISLLAVLPALVLLWAAPAPAATLDAQQKKEIEALVREYLLNNPEILREMSDNLQAKEQLAAQEARFTALKDNAADVFQTAADPVAGNPKGDVTVVEFMDYNCGWCKKGMGEIAA